MLAGNGLNLNALTKTLAAMDLPEIQNYAELHRNDPYVVSMALSIANTKKEAKIAQEGKAGMMPMQPVVPQAISQIAPRPAFMAQPSAPTASQNPLPETVGIGQLPAQNIAKMAGGGIVAFGDGGEVPRFNGMGGSFVGPVMSFQQFLASQGVPTSEFVNLTPQGQQALRDAYKAVGMGAPTGAAPASPATAATPTGAATAPSTSASLSSTLGKYAGALKSGLGGLNALGLGYQLFGTSPEELATLKKADAARLGKATGETLKNLGLPEGSSAAPMSSADVDALTSYNPAATAENKPDGATAPPPAPTQQDRVADLQAQYNKIVGGKPPVAGAGAGISALNTKPMSADEAKAAAGKLYDSSPLTAKLDTLRTDVETDIQNRRQTLLEEQAAMPQYGIEAEKRLRAQEQELAEDKKAAGWMSILEAGLATMAGTSPFAFANIGAGGQKGLASYKDAMKDFKKLQLEYDKAQADIERARYAAKREDFKTRQEFEDRAAARLDNVNKIGVDVTGKIFEVNANTASKIWDTSFAQAQQNLRTQYQEQGATARANAGLQQQAGLELLRLSQPSAQQQFYESLAEPGSRAAKGLETYGRIMGPEAKGLPSLLQKYADPLKLQTLKATDPELYAYVKAQLDAQMRMPTTTPTGPVRP